MPISTASVTVMIVVPRSRPIFHARARRLPAPMPTCTRFFGGTLGMFVAWNQGVVCIRSSRSVSCVSTWRVEVDDAEVLASEMLGDRADGREADRMVAASTTGKAPLA